MARRTDIRALVDRFASDLERAVQAQVNAEFASRFDELRRSILNGETRAPSARGPRRKPGPKAGVAAPEKPCPVCGKENKARRFSYLCEDHRTAENLAKFKGTAGAAPAAAGKRGRARKAG